MTEPDVIDAILGSELTPSAARLRAVKPELSQQMQNYYEAIFAPSEESSQALSPAERWLIAIRTAAHSESIGVVNWYAARAADAGIGEMLISKATATTEPWNGGPRTTAIMRHVDLIVTHPVDSSRADIDTLTDAGLSPTGIVALSQVVAYVSYQLRLIAALRALGEPR